MFKKAVVFSIVLSLLGLSNKGAEWNEPPDIFICKDAVVTEDDIISAMAYWEDFGYKFGYVISDFDCVYDDQRDYRYSFMPGSILIYSKNKGLKEENNLGVTEIGFRDGKILYAVIETKDDDQRVLTHELGHALNIRHIRRRNNIMHPYYENGGWDF
jgi:hypothetical protein